MKISREYSIGHDNLRVHAIELRVFSQLSPYTRH